MDILNNLRHMHGISQKQAQLNSREYIIIQGEMRFGGLFSIQVERRNNGLVSRSPMCAKIIKKLYNPAGFTP
jgi:hypothetical protein